MAHSTTTITTSRLRLAELTSSIGAGVLGVGIGAALGERLESAAAVVIVLGGLIHAWGMFDKHRLEQSGGATRPWWSTALYWICWVGLVLLGLSLVLRRAAGPL